MSISYKMLPTGFDSWYVKLYRELCQLLGSPLKFELGWVASEKKLIIHTDRVDDDLLEQVRTMAEEYMPAWVRLVQYNHDISIPWQEIPEGFTVVEWLESQEKEKIVVRGDLGTSEDIMEAEIFAPDSQQAYRYPIVTSSPYPEGYRNWNYCLYITATNHQSGWAEGKSAVQFQQDIRKYDENGNQVFLRPSDWSTSAAWVDADTKFFIRIINREFFLDGKRIGKVDAKYKHPVSKITSLELFYWWSLTNIRIYNVKRISVETGEVLCNLIPCLDDIGTPCMVDRVTKIAYYTNTGDFLYPGKEEESATFSLRRSIIYAQLTKNGLRRLYHVPKGYNGTKEEYAAENGFKPLVETPMPEEGYWEPHWRETEEEIVLDWIATNPPEEESFS